RSFPVAPSGTAGQTLSNRHLSPQARDHTPCAQELARDVVEGAGSEVPKSLPTRPRTVETSAEAFEDHGHALTAADAHGLEAELLAVVLQRVDERRGDASARHADRVADGDGTAVDVQLVEVDAQVAVGRDHLRGERLVDLDEVDVADGHARARECLLRGLDGA